MKKIVTATLILLTILTLTACMKQTQADSVLKPPAQLFGYNRLATEHFLRAMQFQESGNLFGAVVEFQNAYKQQKDPFIQKRIAECYFYLKQFDNALQALEIALAADSFNEELLFWKLKILQAGKNNSESIAVLESLIKTNPAKIEYYYYLMELQYTTGNLEAASRVIEQALPVATLPKQKQDLYSRLADLALQQNQSDKAESIYQNYLAKEDSTDLAILAQYNRLLFMQQKYSQAIATQKKILQVDTDNLEQHNLLFMLQNNFGNKQEAELTLLNTVNKFKDDASKLTLARFYSEQKDTLKAKILYQSLFKNDSTDVLLYNELAGMYDNLGDKLTAVTIYRQAYAVFPDQHSILNNYAYVLSEIDQNLEFALELSGKSLKKDPDSPSYLDTYGWICYKLGNYSDAEKYIALAIEKDTLKVQQYVLYEHLGDVKTKLTKKSEAMENYKKAQELNPDLDLSEKIKNLQK